MESDGFFELESVGHERKQSQKQRLKANNNTSFFGMPKGMP